MRNRKRTLVLALALCLVSGVALACHSTYFDELFTKLEKQSLSSEQLKDLWTLRNGYIAADHKVRKCDAAHDSHGVEFIAAAAGILDDQQYEAIAGKPKTEVQSLRYEVNQLKKELAEIKALLEELKKQKQ